MLREGAPDLIEKSLRSGVSGIVRNLNVKTLHGHPAVFTNRYWLERQDLTPIGPVSIRIHKVPDCSGQGAKFNSVLVPANRRLSMSLSAGLPWLSLKEILTGEMGAALKVFVGQGAKGLSPVVVSRLKAQ